MSSGFLDNFRVKLFAFVAAFLFWFVVVTGNEYQYELEVAIKPVNLPPGKVILNDLPRRARVRFYGRGQALLALKFLEEAEVALDLSDIYTSGPVAVRPEMVRVSRLGQNIESWEILQPDSIEVRLGQLATKRVPIAADIEVRPVVGYAVVGGVRLTPDSAQVIGPINHIEPISRVHTESRRFEGVKYGISGRIRLRRFPDSLRIQLQPMEVRYDVDVQKLLELTFEEIPVRVIHAPRGWRVSAVPSTLKLTVAGGERLLMQLSRSDISATIDYRRPQQGEEGGYRVELQLPEGVNVIQVYPQYFKLLKERQGSR